MGGDSARKFGERLGISSQFINQVLSGQRRPGPRLLKALGLRCERVTTYTYMEK